MGVILKQGLKIFWFPLKMLEINSNCLIGIFYASPYLRYLLNLIN